MERYVKAVLLLLATMWWCQGLFAGDESIMRDAILLMVILATTFVRRNP